MEMKIDKDNEIKTVIENLYKCKPFWDKERIPFEKALPIEEFKNNILKMADKDLEVLQTLNGYHHYCNLSDANSFYYYLLFFNLYDDLQDNQKKMGYADAKYLSAKQKQVIAKAKKDSREYEMPIPLRRLPEAPENIFARCLDFIKCNDIIPEKIATEIFEIYKCKILDKPYSFYNKKPKAPTVKAMKKASEVNDTITQQVNIKYGMKKESEIKRISENRDYSAFGTDISIYALPVLIHKICEDLQDNQEKLDTTDTKNNDSPK
jgi:hypothetical protein